MAPSLSDLPVELVERIIDYLPHRDTLLYLRLISRDFSAKTSRLFGKAYFTTSTWKLGASSAKAIVHFSNCPDVATYLTSVTLTAPCGNNASYENIWTAKGIYSVKIARALSLFTQLRTLMLVNFDSVHNLKSSWNFFPAFVPNLYLPKLEALTLIEVDIETEDVIHLLKKHAQSIKELNFHSLNLLYKPDELVPGDETPWFDMLFSLESFKNNCEFMIASPKQAGRDAFFQPPLDSWWSAGEYEYMGLTILYMVDNSDDEDGMGDSHLVIEIKGDANWWKGVKILATFNLFNVLLVDVWEDEHLDTHPAEMGEDYWARRLKELLEQKDENRKQAAVKKMKAGVHGSRVRKIPGGNEF
jgi:hypothetical protein